MTLEYIATIEYIDTTTIPAMWSKHFLVCPEHFPSKDAAQKWIDSVLEYWKTPKMSKRVKVESYGIAELRQQAGEQ